MLTDDFDAVEAAVVIGRCTGCGHDVVRDVVLLHNRADGWFVNDETGKPKEFASIEAARICAQNWHPHRSLIDMSDAELHAAADVAQRIEAAVPRRWFRR